MAECKESPAKRKASKLPEKATKKPKIAPELKPCSLKSCSSKEINPNTDCYVEIKAGLPVDGLDTFIQAAAVNWAVNGDARFHKSCWEALLKSCRARNPKNVTIRTYRNEKAIVIEASKTAEYHDSIDIVEREGVRIARLICTAKHCIVFSGAGISTSAGIGDYRGKEGKWTEEDREAVAGAEADGEEGVPYESLRPTYTHEALAKLVKMGLIKYIISQNGDGLHGLSGVPFEHLSELHGNVFVEICEKCDHRYHRSFYVMDDNASQYLEDMEEHGSSVIRKPKHAVKCPLCGLCHRTGRKCEQKGCKSHLKDSIINFGDNLEEAILSQAEEHADEADLCLSLGTTMQVTPACDLVSRGQEPLRLVIVNRQKTGFDDLCLKQEKGKALGSRVFGDCDQVMAQVMRHLLTKEELIRWEGGRAERLKEYDSYRN